jgi:hypothetical protein
MRAAYALYLRTVSRWIQVFRQGFDNWATLGSFALPALLNRLRENGFDIS